MWRRLNRWNPTAYNLLVDGIVFVLFLAATASWAAEPTVLEWLVLSFSGTLAMRLLLNWR